MTKGILLSAWGKRGYIYAAYNLAFSIKHFNKMLPIVLYCDTQLLTQINKEQQDIFDEIIPIETSLLYQHQKSPANIKTSVYDFLPFDYTLFLDVDALALQDLEPCIDEMVAQGGYFYSHILNTHKLEQGNDIKDMFWAKADVIWNKYALDKEAVLPCTNSSFQFIKKGDESKKLFDLVRKNLADPIPLNELKNQWGASQPDELYLNVAMAQMGITGKTGEYMFMGNVLSPLPFHKLQEKYYILSIFGGKNFTKIRYTEWYDKLLIKYHREHAKSAHFKYQYIARDKHANTRPISFSKEKSRFEIQKESHVKTAFESRNTGERIVLISGWYRAKSERRQKELDFCIERNLENKEIDKVLVVTEDECYLQHEKLSIAKVENRPTYNTFFEHLNAEADENTISILCNADIYLDAANAQKLRGVNFSGRCLALSRWDEDVNGRHKLFNYEWSQDTWIFKGKVQNVSCETFLGVMQCDNRVAFELSKIYEVVNPSKDIQTFHVHKSGERNYDVHAFQEGEKKPIQPEPAQRILKKRLLLNQPGKVGDILICAPIAEHYAKEYFVDWHCPDMYHSLFKYLPYANPVNYFKEKYYDKVIDLSFGLGGHPEKWWQQNRARFDSFVRAKFELAGVAFTREVRFVRNIARENALYELIKKDFKNEYVLVHESSDYGTPIQVKGNNVLKFQPILDYTIFDWYKVVKRAKEIHCIDSSLCNFVDIIGTEAKLFYYKTDRIPNKWDETILTKNWQRNDISITA